MQVILLEKIRNLGNLGDMVSVKPGYGRNFLIPYGKAVSATKSNIALFEARRSDLEKQAQERLDKALSRAETLNNQVITIAARAAEEGKLYGSVSTHEVTAAMNKMGLEVQRKELNLQNGVIRQTGEYPLIVELHSDVQATLTVKVIAE